MDVHVQRTVPITYEMVAKAYQKVKTGGKASGIDQESWRDFEEKGVEKQLYVIWNRMSSGSYHPQAVREVEIPKKNGKKRKLGIPTIRDRIAQQVVRLYMEKQIEHQFHDNSYGYRPMKSSHQALEEVRKNCFEKDWVVDVDISKFFDEIDHELMLKAVEWMHEERWVKVYVKRWLEMKVEKADGTQHDRQGKGTPQGGVISPLLANLFLHFALDMWLSKHYPTIHFVRYADDIVLHCQNKEEAEGILAAIRQRLEQVKLRLNEEKSRIVYCKDYRRREEHKHVQFGFLGFSFQPRQAPSRQCPGTSFTAFTAEISRDNQLKIRTSIREDVNWRNTTQELRDIAGKLNDKVRGWINYFGCYGKKNLRRMMVYLDIKLVKWLMRKHKESLRRSMHLLATYQIKYPKMFYHWQKQYCINVNEITRAV
jgi:RNA-directed DNA polymerase